MNMKQEREISRKNKKKWLHLKKGINLIKEADPSDPNGLSLYADVVPEVVRWFYRDRDGNEVSSSESKNTCTKVIVTTVGSGSCRCYGTYDNDTGESEDLGCTDGCSTGGEIGSDAKTYITYID